MIFVGILFMGTGTPIPFFDSQEENEIEFSFSGQSTSLHFEPSESPSNNGWAVYSFGQYSDEDEDGIWDDCGIVEISLSDNSEGDFFYLQCDNSTQREEIADMIYVGQMCFDPTNESSPRCNEGNYSLESNVYVKLVQEFGQDDDQPLFSRILEWLVDGLATGRTILCSSFPLLILSIFLSFTLSDEEAEPPTRLSSATTAEWRAYSLSGQERGDDGLPKAFSRHSEKKEIFRKPRKGNRRGGVHKSGGLYLDGWTDEDSDAAYKKKVEDRRKDR